MNVDELMSVVAKQPTYVQRASGVSRSTMKRIKDGTTVPTLETLEELAAALGYEVRVSIEPSGDPFAAVAAREILGDVSDPSAAKWVERLERRGIKSPEELVRVAGVLASPRMNRTAKFFSPRPGVSARRLPLAVASAAKGTRFAISGAAAATRLLDKEITGPTVVWAEDAGAVEERLRDSMDPATRYQPAGVVLVESPHAILADCFQEGQVFWAAPIQVVMDLHGLGMPAAAHEISKDW